MHKLEKEVTEESKRQGAKIEVNHGFETGNYRTGTGINATNTQTRTKFIRLYDNVNKKEYSILSDAKRGLELFKSNPQALALYEKFYYPRRKLRYINLAAGIGIAASYVGFFTSDVVNTTNLELVNKPLLGASIGFFGICTSTIIRNSIKNKARRKYIYLAVREFNK